MTQYLMPLPTFYSNGRTTHSGAGLQTRVSSTIGAFTRSGVLPWSDLSRSRPYSNAGGAARYIDCVISRVARTHSLASVRPAGAFWGSCDMSRRTIAGGWRSFTILRTPAHGMAHVR